MKTSNLIDTLTLHSRRIRSNKICDESTKDRSNFNIVFHTNDISLTHRATAKHRMQTILSLLIVCILTFGSHTASADDTALGLSPLITYSVQQVSNNRYLDAHENNGQDFRLVTRTEQNNNTQRWRFTPLGNDIYTIQQVSNNRFVDAHEHNGQDFRLVTRPAQNNNTQRWRLVPQGNDRYTIQQVSNNRFVDAHEHNGQDFRVVTRPAQNNDTQSWYIKPINIHTIQQVSNNRFVDAHEHNGQDFRLVTRPAQNNNTQRWEFTHLGDNNYTIQQVSNGRFVDAHEHNGQDFRLVTRPAQNNNTQIWKLTPLGNNRYTIQQASNNRFVDAHEHSGQDYRLVTRPAQNNNTQRWIVKPDKMVASSVKISISRHNSANLTNARADTILQDASNTLIEDAGSNDISCFVALERDGGVEVFNTGDGSLDTNAELQAVFNRPGNVKIVDDVNFCDGGFNTSFIGCGQTPGDSFIVERFTAAQEGILWAHEHGHNTGLPHRDTSTNNVMYFSIGSNRTRVNQNECNSFKSSAPALSASTASSAEKSPPSAKLPVRDFVSNIYFDGLPLNIAATYSADDAATLMNMLKDPEQERYHENIALTLGMIGDPKSVDLLIEYVNKPVVENESRAEHKGRVGAIVALGYLVNRSKSKKALTFLKQSSIPETWQQRNIKGFSSSDVKMRRTLSKYSIISLGLSGDPEAFKHLEMLNEEPQKIPNADAIFLDDVKAIVSESIKLNQRISREGLLKYYER